MSDATDQDFGGSVARGGWRCAGIAIAVAIGILAIALLTATGIGSLHDAYHQTGAARAYAPGEMEALVTERLSLFLITFQAGVIVLTVLAAKWVVQGSDRLISFARPRGGFPFVAVAVAGLMAAAMLLAFAVYVLDPSALYNDIGPYSTMLHTRAWWMLMVAAAVGAPFAEELLFRGYLHGVLRSSPLGVSGSAILTSGLWAALHPGYSIYSIAAIFLIGLYLVLLRERTGSLTVPVACHAAYNGLISLVLAFALPAPISP